MTFTTLIDNPIILIQGALTGFLFGFLLQKGAVSRFNRIVGQLLLRDFTVLKIILTAIVVGGIGVYAMWYAEIIPTLYLKALPHWGIITGGVIFGIGMATLGYCPGTCIAAAGQGSKDALSGIGGMIFGALIYSVISPWCHTLQATKLSSALTLPVLFGLPSWLFLLILTGGAVGLFIAIETYNN